jgi:hypothetical protein
MEKHRRVYSTQIHTTRPRLQQKHAGSSIKWMIIVAFCVALTVFLVSLASAARTSGGSSTEMQKKQQLVHAGSTNLPVQLAPTRQAGIFNVQQGPFLGSIFTVRNSWQGPVGSDWVLAYAGAKANANGTAGQGGIVLYTETVNKSGGFDLYPLGTFLAPTGYTALSITAVQGDLITVRSVNGQTLTFHLQTHQFR